MRDRQFNNRIPYFTFYIGYSTFYIPLSFSKKFAEEIYSLKFTKIFSNLNRIHMELEQFFSAGYRGSKAFKQLDVPNADATGFGSPTDDYMDRGIDLNEQLIRNKPATFFMKVQGSSMINACIHHGDIVIVDRSIKPESGKIIIAVIDGEMLIRRFEKTMNRIRLIPETPKLSPMEINHESDFSIWGVVTYVIKSLTV